MTIMVIKKERFMKIAAVSDLKTPRIGELNSET
jgi:hypothetical protein